MKKMLLVDGNAMFFKSFYGTFMRLKAGAERNSKGEPVNALRLFSIMMINLKKQFEPDYMLVAFDERGAQTFRHKYDFYKAGRPTQPDDLYIQMPMVKKFLELYGIRWVADINHEADDIIGIIAKLGQAAGQKVDIITTDKDLLQLVQPNVDVHLSIRGVSEMDKYSVNNFSDKFFGLTPAQIIDFKAIAGDNSDNIEGIKGIGEKGAVKLLTEYETFENVYNFLDDLTPGLKSKLELNKEIGELSKRLATIITEYDEEIDLNNLEVNMPKIEELVKYLEEMTLFNIIDKVNK